MTETDSRAEGSKAVTRIRRLIEDVKARPAACFSTWGLVLHAGVPLPFDGRSCPVCRSAECELGVALVAQQESFMGVSHPGDRDGAEAYRPGYGGKF